MIFWPYYILKIPAGVTYISQAIDNYFETLNQTIDHLLEFIPKDLLIINPRALPNTCGMTLYSNTICLNESYILEKILEIAKAECTLTLLHELAHYKQIEYYSNQRFFLFTSDKLEYEKMGEAGDFLEDKLFGGWINLQMVTVRIANLIIDPENYSTAQKLAQLKENLRPYVVKFLDSSQHTINRG